MDSAGIHRAAMLAVVSTFYKRILENGDYDLIDSKGWLLMKQANMEIRSGIVDSNGGTHPLQLWLEGAVTGKSLLRYSGESADWLLKRAIFDPIAYDAALNVAASMIRRGDPLPVSLADFAADALLGSRTKPLIKGRHPRANSARDDLIAFWVGHVVEAGFPAMRNEATEHRDSGCDIVADALAANGLGPTSYEAVKKIWLHNKFTGRLRQMRRKQMRGPTNQ